MPIAMSKEEWGRLSRWADVGREDPEVTRRREYVKYLNAASQQMTKNWPNSLENVNKRNEELRRARIEAAEQANTKFYKKYVRRKQEEQAQLMHSARDIMFRNKDAPKMLLSAVIETVVHKEREEQRKFNEMLRQRAAEQKRKDDDEVIKQSKDWHELMALRRRRRFDANKQHQKDLVDQAHEVADRNRDEYETELNLQKIDNIKADQQMDAIKKFEEEFKAAEKTRIFADMKRSRQEAEARRHECAARERMDERLLQVLLNSRARVEQKRRQTEKEVKDEKLRVLEKISQKLESGDAAREAKEQAILDKAIREKEAAAEARRLAQEKKKEQFKQQRVEDRKKFLQDEEARLRDFHTVRQWDIMNRFKNVEMYNAFQEELREQRQRKIEEYREDILKLWAEKDDREAREKAELRSYYGEQAEKKLRDADNKLLQYAEILCEEAARHQRPDYALRKAIRRYIQYSRLVPMPELAASLREHFPHAEAPRAVRAFPLRGPPGVPPGDTRSGLQEPGPSKPTVQKEDTVEDYKRAGRANGLQRTDASQ